MSGEPIHPGGEEIRCGRCRLLMLEVRLEQPGRAVLTSACRRCKFVAVYVVVRDQRGTFIDERIAVSDQSVKSAQ